MAPLHALKKSARNRPRYTPVRVLGGFFLALAAATLMTTRQAQERDLLESTEAPTGVGDLAYFEVRRPFVPRRPAAMLSNERPLFPQAREPESRNDTEMRKIGWWRRFHLYRDAREAPDSPWIYVKTDKGRYLRLGPSPIREDETTGS